MHTEILLAGIFFFGEIAPTPAPNGSPSEGLEVRYARAQLQLAEASLKRVQQGNKQIERSVPSSVVAEYQQDVQVAKTRLEQASAGRAAREFQVWLQRADAE